VSVPAERTLLGSGREEARVNLETFWHTERRPLLFPHGRPAMGPKNGMGIGGREGAKLLEAVFLSPPDWAAQARGRTTPGLAWEDEARHGHGCWGAIGCLFEDC